MLIFSYKMTLTEKKIFYSYVFNMSRQVFTNTPQESIISIYREFKFGTTFFHSAKAFEKRDFGPSTNGSQSLI